MAPSTPKNALIIVFDVGKSVSQVQPGEDIPFVKNATRCASMILQRKLVSQSLDELGILLMGTNEPDTSGLVLSGFDNICCKFEIQPVSWEMLNFIDHEVKCTDLSCDWIDALVVAMELLRAHAELNKIAEQQIVFFSDFSHPVSADKVTTIVKNLKKLGIELIVIGTNAMLKLGPQNGEGPPSKKIRLSNGNGLDLLKSDELLCFMKEELEENMKLMNFELALQHLLSYTRKAVRCTPWYTNLDIGDIQIRVAAYKKIDPQKTMPSFKSRGVISTNPATDSNIDHQEPVAAAIDGPSTSTAVRDRVMHYKHINPDTKEVEEIPVTQDEVIEGYRYGTTIVPFTAEDKAALSYKSGPRCLSIIGFTSMENIPHYLLSGQTVYYVVARHGDENAEVALSSFIQAMAKNNRVAIARRVYNTDSAVTIGLLYPLMQEYDEDVWKECLLFIEIAFNEEFHPIKFDSLDEEAQKLTPQQVSAVDKLIDDLDLMDAEVDMSGNTCEAFDFTSLKDFKNQFYQYCVVQKALYPGKSLPEHIPDYIQNFCVAPKSIQQKQKDCGEILKQNFKLELLKEKKEVVEKDLFENQVDIFDQYKKPEDGSLHKMDSWNATLPGTNKHTAEKLNDMKFDNNFEKIFYIHQFPPYSSIDDRIRQSIQVEKIEMEEALDILQNCLNKLKLKCLNTSTKEYNQWTTQYKSYLFNKSPFGVKIWKHIFEKGNFLITQKENSDGLSEAEVDLFGQPSFEMSLPLETVNETSSTSNATQMERDDALNCLFD